MGGTTWSRLLIRVTPATMADKDAAVVESAMLGTTPSSMTSPGVRHGHLNMRRADGGRWCVLEVFHHRVLDLRALDGPVFEIADSRNHYNRQTQPN